MSRLQALTAAFVLSVAGCVGSGDPQEGGDGQSDKSSQVEVRDLGDVPFALDFDTLKLTSEDLHLEVPPGTLSMTFYAQAAQAADNVAIEYLHGPAGDTLADADNQFFSASVPGQLSFTLPREARELEAGTYTIKLAGQQRTTGAHVWVILRKGSAPQRGVLDLNLYFVLGSGLSHSDMTTTSAILDRAFALLGMAGIELGEVHTHDISDIIATKFVEPRDFGALYSLRALSEKDPPGLNVFFIHNFEDGPDGTYEGRVLGMAGGIPGAPALQGKFGSGILISIGPLTIDGKIDTDAIGAGLAHEMGHSMGLLHTTEADGKVHDPVSDTPECPASADADGDGQLLGLECLDYDARNLMFWNMRHFVRKQAEPSLTKEQQFVILRSPLLRDPP